MGSIEQVDESDKIIIKMLTENARVSLREIAAVVKMSPSSVRNRMERLVELGVIKRYTLDIDYRKMGFEIQVVILVTSKPSEADRLNLALKGYDEITEVLRTSGPASFICNIRVRSIKELTKFITGELEKLNGVERIETLFILPQDE
ncbi:MAG: Lrp/AsnC family transcriptional regulator [Candidatus Thorarchaeota archaeon]